MSESANCEEQREEQTELEEAGGAEVRWFKMGIVSSTRTYLFHTDVTQVSNSDPLFQYTCSSIC